ncbi:Asr1405/Asl0597 family protein [Calothrix sp. 336/3]|uniref:Asr1405/Asl0597 family protein n=1 Tax=Calothrix sp. 336/3 TaxID=1337936 RepID=UPI0004E3A69C|nr:Asr1405/Asl0597 family protein [Calothrix sp. 336/3]AKG24147.1 hypothetical protein IJ00_25025 [Calothrix sp. 336/3]
MFQPCSFDAASGYLVEVPVGDRWLVFHRLQELMIPCACLSDGSLAVQIDDCLTAILVYSIVKRFTASRQDLVDYLESCWFPDLGF